MSAEVQAFIASLLHRRGIDDRDNFAARMSYELDGLSPWTKAAIGRTVRAVKTDLYRRNPSAPRDGVVDLLATRISRKWGTNPTAKIDERLHLKILFISANPTEVVAYHPVTNAPLTNFPLRLDQEVREISNKLRMARHRETFRLVPCPAAKPTDLLQALNEEQPQIVHFSGHGTPVGELVLLDDAGRAVPVRRPVIESLFKVMKGRIRVVLLNACFSKLQAGAIAKHVDCCIGMRNEIGDKAAITFSAAFYSAIGFGCSVKEAFEQAVLQLQLSNIAENNTPKLIAKRGTNPAKVTLIAN